ncbi:hypothetical protein ACYSNR_17390 [Enterococcus sp. LJL128]|uniref:hypothetical protein n=1 Tax=Enterococcus sp. LJL51 TaxID=3416656 RepID=UPI003CE68CAD
MNKNNSTIKNIFVIALVIIIGISLLGVLGNLIGFAIKLLIPCAIIYVIFRWLSGGKVSTRR